MHKLVIGNFVFFLSTYLISIFAAAYGVSKFFRLGHARIAKGFFSKRFLFVAVVSTTFFVFKGVVLASIVMDTDNTLVQSMV